MEHLIGQHSQELAKVMHRTQRLSAKSATPHMSLSIEGKKNYLAGGFYPTPSLQNGSSGLFVRPIIATKDQLDQLEDRGYLNPGDRGNRADECEAIASFLTDAPTKSR